MPVDPSLLLRPLKYEAGQQQKRSRRREICNNKHPAVPKNSSFGKGGGGGAESLQMRERILELSGQVFVVGAMVFEPFGEKSSTTRCMVAISARSKFRALTTGRFLLFFLQFSRQKKSFVVGKISGICREWETSAERSKTVTTRKRSPPLCM